MSAFALLESQKKKREKWIRYISWDNGWKFPEPEERTDTLEKESYSLKQEKPKSTTIILIKMIEVKNKALLKSARENKEPYTGEPP